MCVHWDPPPELHSWGHSYCKESALVTVGADEVSLKSTGCSRKGRSSGCRPPKDSPFSGHPGSALRSCHRWVCHPTVEGNL